MGRKIGFGRAKSELDLFTKRTGDSFLALHNGFGWQAKTATTNGVFYAKKAKIRVVKTSGFFYNFPR
jgi:hypothetical protein